MRRGKRILKIVWEDLWVGLGLVLVLCAAQFFRSYQWDLEKAERTGGFFFSRQSYPCVGGYLDPDDLFQI